MELQRHLARTDIEQRLALHPDILTVPDAADRAGGPAHSDIPNPKECRRCRQQYIEREGIERRLARLTARQYQVFVLVVSGETNHEIAATFGVKVRTVATHLAEVMRKMEAPSPVVLGRLAERVGIVWPSA